MSMTPEEDQARKTGTGGWRRGACRGFFFAQHLRQLFAETFAPKAAHCAALPVLCHGVFRLRADEGRLSSDGSIRADGHVAEAEGLRGRFLSLSLETLARRSEDAPNKALHQAASDVPKIVAGGRTYGRRCGALVISFATPSPIAVPVFELILFGVNRHEPPRTSRRSSSI